MNQSRPSTRQRVLVVDDDDSIRDVVSTALDVAGYTVDTAADGNAAMAVLDTNRFDLIVLDMMMPGRDGRDVCRQLRADGDQTPVIFLTARDSPADALEGFALGGDDYLAKPFHLPVLVARVEAVLRRAAGSSSVAGDLLHFADIAIDVPGHRVERAGTRIELSPTEFRLLSYLILNQGTVVSKVQIAEHLWGTPLEGDGNIVETHMSYLRKKLGQPRLIETVRGFGYVVREEP